MPNAKRQKKLRPPPKQTPKQEQPPPPETNSDPETEQRPDGDKKSTGHKSELQLKLQLKLQLQADLHPVRVAPVGFEPTATSILPHRADSSVWCLPKPGPRNQGTKTNQVRELDFVIMRLCIT